MAGRKRWNRLHKIENEKNYGSEEKFANETHLESSTANELGCKADEERALISR
jgi:hypothetical protein